MTHADKLRQATKLLGEILSDLDDNTFECPCCKATRFHNRDEFQARQSIAACQQRLERMAGQIWAKQERDTALCVEAKR